MASVAHCRIDWLAMSTRCAAAVDDYEFTPPTRGFVREKWSMIKAMPTLAAYAAPGGPDAVVGARTTPLKRRTKNEPRLLCLACMMT